MKLGRARVFIVALVSLSFLLLAASTALGQWSIEDVDSARAIYGSASLTFDALGRPVVAYGGEAKLHGGLASGVPSPTVLQQEKAPHSPGLVKF